MQFNLIIIENVLLTNNASVNKNNLAFVSADSYLLNHNIHAILLTLPINAGIYLCILVYALFSEPKFAQLADGLLIRNVSREESKVYICQAMEPSTGDIKEQKIKLKVQRK